MERKDRSRGLLFGGPRAAMGAGAGQAAGQGPGAGFGSRFGGGRTGKIIAFFWIYLSTICLLSLWS